MKKKTTYHVPRTAYHGMMMAIIITLLAACDSNDPAANDSDTQVRAIITATIASPPYEGGVPRRGEGVKASSSINTKAVDAYGYDGLKKTAFVTGDEISIAYKIGMADYNIVATYNATSDKWTTATDFYIDANTPNIEASYTKAYTEAAGITTYHDDLQAFANPRAPIKKDDPYTLDFTFDHCWSLLKTSLTYLNGQPVPAADIAAIHIYIADGNGVEKKLATDALGACIAPSGVTITRIDITPTTGAVITGHVNASAATEKGKTYTLQVTMATTTATITINEDGISAWSTPIEGRIQNTTTLHYIYDEDGLIAFRDAVNGNPSQGINGNSTLNAIQMKDIVLTATTNWEPIGNGNNVYSGTYNGNGYTIAGLKIDGTVNVDRVGFFGTASGSTLVNIHLTGVDIKTTSHSAGALVGYTNTTTIALCSSSGTVEGAVNAGGLIGGISHSHLTRSRSTCRVSVNNTTDVVAGGLVGYSSDNVIAACMAGGTVTANTTTINNISRAGGLVGYSGSTPPGGINITHSYATGTATATAIAGSTAYSGGLVGENGGSIRYSYTIQPTLTSGGTGIISSWWPGQAGTAGSTVRAADITGNEAPVRTWINGEVKTVIFNASVWTDGDYPTLKYNNTGTVQP